MMCIESLTRVCCIFTLLVCSQFAASALAQDQEVVPQDTARRTPSLFGFPAGDSQQIANQPAVSALTQDQRDNAQYTDDGADHQGIACAPDQGRSRSLRRWRTTR